MNFNIYIYICDSFYSTYFLEKNFSFTALDLLLPFYHILNEMSLTFK